MPPQSCRELSSDSKCQSAACQLDRARWDKVPDEVANKFSDQWFNKLESVRVYDGVTAAQVETGNPLKGQNATGPQSPSRDEYAKSKVLSKVL